VSHMRRCHIAVHNAFCGACKCRACPVLPTPAHSRPEPHPRTPRDQLHGQEETWTDQGIGGTATVLAAHPRLACACLPSALADDAANFAAGGAGSAHGPTERQGGHVQ